MTAINTFPRPLTDVPCLCSWLCGSQVAQIQVEDSTVPDLGVWRDIAAMTRMSLKATSGREIIMTCLLTNTFSRDLPHCDVRRDLVFGAPRVSVSMTRSQCHQPSFPPIEIHQSLKDCSTRDQGKGSAANRIDVAPLSYLQGKSLPL